ncbi:MAG: hypothetical protein JKY55_06505 [Aliivibrio sp.]|uniref:hypothetical protein n=1 Tax=Aliivibrio sp. TaxID=1872443 RepID=UPI001A47DF9E|nr:hypothetical protein [Aliivibrio sp.]
MKILSSKTRPDTNEDTDTSPQTNLIDDGTVIHLAFTFSLLGVWLVAPILHGVSWPFAKALVTTFYGDSWVQLAKVTHMLAALAAAYTGLNALLHHRLSILKK